VARLDVRLGDMVRRLRPYALAAVGVVALIVAGCAASARRSATTTTSITRFSGSGLDVSLPSGWKSLGWGAIAPNQPYAAVEMLRQSESSVASVRFWPMILNHAFMANDASTLVRQFPPSAVYLQVVVATHDPFPGPVSPTLASGSGLIRRSWAPGHHLLLIGYFGPKAPKMAAKQADWIGTHASPRPWSGYGPYTAD
jgi:hypothetical protein